MSLHAEFRPSTSPCLVPRITGADVELANSILGRRTRGGTGYEASRALLREIEGVRATRASQAVVWTGASSWQDGGSYGGAPATPAGYHSQDYGRKHLPENGGCVYIDLNHCEICLPEVWSAYDHVAAQHAMFRIAREAMVRAQAKLPVGEELCVLANNSDGRSHSYGSHLNLLVRRRTWDNIFVRKCHYLALLASHQVSSIVYTGQGKVGVENGRSKVPYQISQRADFFESLEGWQTTHTRPIVNSRDESLCGLPSSRWSNGGTGAAEPTAADELARLHCIFYDVNLAHVATLLKVGAMQIVTSMIEAEHVNLALLLDDPVAAVHAYSHDPELRTTCRLASGARVTAVEHQRMVLDEARRFAETGALDGIVPRWPELLDLWDDTLAKLAAGDVDGLVGRCDWVLKREILREAVRRDPGLSWSSRDMHFLDQTYGHLDPRQGLYWPYEEAGVVERVVGEAEIERFVHEPPEDTRAWTRAMLLRAAGPDAVDRVDWDSVTLYVGEPGFGARRVVVELDDPRRFGRAETAAAFDDNGSLGDVLEALTGGPAPSRYH